MKLLKKWSGWMADMAFQYATSPSVLPVVMLIFFVVVVGIAQCAGGTQ